MSRRFLSILTLCIAALSVQAQIQHGGSPMPFDLQNGSPEIDYLRMPDVDVQAARAQDEVTDQYKETPYRFGIEHDVDLDFFDYAQGDGSIEGVTTYRMGIDCEGARTVNVLFDEFYIPEGGQLFIYNEDRSEILGAFTHESNKESGVFPVGMVIGERIVIEYTSAVGNPSPTLHIGQIVHGYRPILNKWQDERGPFGNSGACNINVNCPEGLPWEQQKRSVALIVSGGFAQCSGAMINNTNFDQTPYFLSANHCLGNPSNWVYYFNHESSGCSGSTGPTNQSISGGTLRANSNVADFALIELSEVPPADYNVFFSGWDNSDDEDVTLTVGIHHPSGDVKKICFDNDAPYHDTQGAAAVWWIDEWEDGVTEGGSSGSPLFDQNGRIIGQLFGGAAACSGSVNNGAFDYYGRLGVAWDNGSNNNSLQPWLDPSNSGAETLDGYGPNDVTYDNDAGSLGISGAPSDFCGTVSFTPSFEFRNNGNNTLESATIAAWYNGVGQPDIEWTGSLEPGESEDVSLSEMTTIPGDNNIEVEIQSPNGVDDENPVNNTTIINFTGAPSGLESLELLIGTDNWGYEVYWEVREIGGDVIQSGGNPFVGLDNIDTNDANPGGDVEANGYANNDNIQEIITLPANGCYEFHITDFYGDGITGGGNGYQLRDAQGTVLAQGSDYGAEEISPFEMDGVTGLGEEITDFGIRIYPNPTDGLLRVDMTAAEGVDALLILDLSGRVLQTARTNGMSILEMDVQDLPAGSYLIEFRSEDARGVQRFQKY